MSLQVRRIPRDHNPFPQVGLRLDGGSPRFEGLPHSLAAMLREHATLHPDREAVVEVGGERLTYRELWDRASAVAGGLRDQGLGRGDRVAVRYPAGVDWVVAFFGTVLAGGITVVPNIRSTATEMAVVLDDAGVTFDLGPGTTLPHGEPFQHDQLGPDDIAAMFYTSGTTGRPKGVPTRHEAFLTNAENMVRTMQLPDDLGPGLRTLISVPLFHVTGCNSQLMTALYVGGTAVIIPELDLPTLTRTLGTERITFLVTVPAVYALLLRHPSFVDADLRHVRWVGYGGAPIAPSLVADLQAAFPSAKVFNGYGMTESAALMTGLPHEDAVEQADSVGYAMPSVELGILPSDEDPSVGELVARGANIMKGYWNRPEETAATLVDGWLRTGDMVRVDDRGRVHIVDRLKDIIIRGGENISSVEVEAALASAPGVLEAAVLAVPDDVMGEKVGAVVHSGAGSLDIDEVLAHCREHLSDFKVPQYLHVSAEPLPRNAGGKVLKATLRGSVAWGAPLR
ncbi:MAG: class I adenylate-forming enzyme family protein [Marmoricola sp.]